MTAEELAAIRHCIDNGMGLTHERARALWCALEEARTVARKMLHIARARGPEPFGLTMAPWILESSEGVNDD